MSKSSFKNASKEDLCTILKHIGIDDAERCCKDDIREFINKNFKVYKPHNNGGRPYEVYVAKDIIVAFPLKFDDEYENSWFDYDDPVFILKNYDKIWLGDDFKPIEPYDYFEVGNSILIKKGKDYYFFTYSDIGKFRTKNDEKIIRFGSPIVGSDIPYPFVIGEKYTYFLTEKKFMIPNIKNAKNADVLTITDLFFENYKNNRTLNVEYIHRNDI